jgi:hypothetical protein
MFVALGIQHALRMRRIVICGLPCFTIFFHEVLQRFQEEWKPNWIGCILLRNHLIKHVIEGSGGKTMKKT